MNKCRKCYNLKQVALLTNIISILQMVWIQMRIISRDATGVMSESMQ